MDKRQNQEFHNQVCQLIAEKRFPFPSDEHPNWETYVNEPNPQKCFREDRLCPDIVVLENNYAKLLGEVETDDTVNEESTAQWKDYAEIADLYLYVPKSYGALARKLATDIEIAGFREYGVRDGEIQIINV